MGGRELCLDAFASAGDALSDNFVELLVGACLACEQEARLVSSSFGRTAEGEVPAQQIKEQEASRRSYT